MLRWGDERATKVLVRVEEAQLIVRRPAGLPVSGVRVGLEGGGVAGRGLLRWD